MCYIASRLSPFDSLEIYTSLSLLELTFHIHWLDGSLEQSVIQGRRCPAVLRLSTSIGAQPTEVLIPL